MDSINNVIAEFTVPLTGRKYRIDVINALNLKNIKIAMEVGSMDKMDLIINTGYDRIVHTPEEIFELAEIAHSQIVAKQSEIVERERAKYEQ
jgi:hypothetical protein